MFKGGDGKATGEDAPFSLENALAFQQRLETDPDAISDVEIEAQYGSDISPADFRDLFRKNTFAREAKNQRASARAKLGRRLLWLRRSLEEVESAVADVCAAPGRTNKQGDLDGLLAAITAFRAAAKLPKSPEPREINFGLVERALGLPTHDPKQDASAPDDQSD